MDETEKTQVKPPVIGKLAGSAVRSMAGWLFVILALGLMLLPFVSAFNDALTQMVIGLRGYRVITAWVVPTEVRWVVVLLRAVGVPARAAGEYIQVDKPGVPLLVEVIWNCVGWQSLLTFLITAFVGFQPKYKMLSKVKAMVIGVAGTVLLNVVRIALVILLFSNVNPGIATVFHDYGALLTNTAWLFGYWWFVFEFVLEEPATKL